MQGCDKSNEEAARLYALGLQLVKEGDWMLAEAFQFPQKKDEEYLLESLLLQREAIAKQREGLALIDTATAMRCEAIKNRQPARPAATQRTVNDRP